MGKIIQTKKKGLKGSSKKGITDFKKKSAKVGKKVIRSNVTSISVKSKKIHMPLQQSVYYYIAAIHSFFLLLLTSVYRTPDGISRRSG
jgi:hypothetical protein